MTNTDSIPRKGRPRLYDHGAMLTMIALGTSAAETARVLGCHCSTAQRAARLAGIDRTGRAKRATRISTALLSLWNDGERDQKALARGAKCSLRTVSTFVAGMKKYT